VARDRAVSTDDRVIDAAPGDDLYRVSGVEPHGWSTVLIEDQVGRYFVASVVTGRLTEVQSSDAQQMIQRRTYRRWHGDRSWATLDRLPLVANAAPRPMPVPDATEETVN
jgi:coenzyme F420-reducing hydrogenase beta subunit